MAYDPALVDRLREVLAAERGLSEKRMFGGLAFLLGGHLTVAASGHGGLLVRCDPQRSAELLAHDHVERMVMRGRAMDGWLRVLPAAVATDEQLRTWVGEAVAFVHTLAPK